VLDNGGAFISHPSAAAIDAAKPHVRVFWLPRYTSEALNWIGGFWEELKATYFSCMLTVDRDSFHGAAVHLLRRVCRQVAPGIHFQDAIPGRKSYGNR